MLLYDEATAEWQPEPGAPASVLGLLLQKLRDDGCQAYYLQGKGGSETQSGIGALPWLPDAPDGGGFHSPCPACPAGATSPPLASSPPGLPAQAVRV